MFGNETFVECNRAVFESVVGGAERRSDMPLLTSIQMGYNAFSFKDVDGTALVMKSVRACEA